MPVAGSVEITDERWQELLAGQAAGQEIVEDEHGRPALAAPTGTHPTPFYEEQVQMLVRKQYSVADELAILRQRDTKPDEFAAYYEYVEKCKMQAKNQTCNER